MTIPPPLYTIAASPGGNCGHMTRLTDGTFLVQQRSNASVLKFNPATGTATTFATYANCHGPEPPFPVRDGSFMPLTDIYIDKYPSGGEPLTNTVWAGFRIEDRPGGSTFPYKEEWFFRINPAGTIDYYTVIFGYVDQPIEYVGMVVEHFTGTGTDYGIIISSDTARLARWDHYSSFPPYPLVIHNRLEMDSLWQDDAPVTNPDPGTINAMAGSVLHQGVMWLAFPTIDLVGIDEFQNPDVPYFPNVGDVHITSICPNLREPSPGIASDLGSQGGSNPQLPPSEGAILASVQEALGPIPVLIRIAGFPTYQATLVGHLTPPLEDFAGQPIIGLSYLPTTTEVDPVRYFFTVGDGNIYEFQATFVQPFSWWELEMLIWANIEIVYPDNF